ncbi:hypothetical protein HPB49_026009 [Dermacentor silvarum]|nr:hypothetical protein HPB49_026009 [Dermacentor silvarum]
MSQDDAVDAVDMTPEEILDWRENLLRHQEAFTHFAKHPQNSAANPPEDYSCTPTCIICNGTHETGSSECRLRYKPRTPPPAPPETKLTLLTRNNIQASNQHPGQEKPQSNSGRKNSATVAQVLSSKQAWPPLTPRNEDRPPINHTKHIRLRKETVGWLCDEVAEELGGVRSTALPVERQVLCALRFFATGSFQGSVGSEETIGVTRGGGNRPRWYLQQRYRTLLYEQDRAANIVAACAVLHNLCLDESDSAFDDVYDDDSSNRSSDDANGGPLPRGVPRARAARIMYLKGCAARDNVIRLFRTTRQQHQHYLRRVRRQLRRQQHRQQH